MTYFLDLRAASCGGSPAADVTPRLGWNPITIAEMVGQIRGKDVLLGTHGFNVNREDGINSLSNWEGMLQLGSSSLFFGVLWPGDSKWAPVIDYPFEGDEAVMSGRLLGPFLDKYFADAASLSIVSHSLGARMVLETISRMNRRVRRLVIMAGAIDDNCLTGEYRNAAKKVDNISVLASHGDDVLSLAFPAGNFLGGIITCGHPYWHAALGREGPSAPYPVNIRSGWQIPDAWDYGHLDYLALITGVPLSLPVDVPLPPPPPTPIKPAWSAGFVSTRFR
jgi:pimeloyl-ACP methyl ester carboxylesterase